MFSFEGDFKRAPIQNLGGNTNNYDRDTLIRKAKDEREKRANLRKHNNCATTIQSYTRSYRTRQIAKQQQQQAFDDYMKRKGLNNINDLEFLLKRLLFFYYPKNQQDGERLISLSQYCIKNVGNILQTLSTVTGETVWMFRIKRLLYLCTQQILSQTLSQTIPLRILETFLFNNNILNHIHHPDEVQIIQKSFFSYLIRRRYYHFVRRLLEEKVPPLDGPITTPMNGVSEILLQMIIEPLNLTRDNCEFSKTTIYAFVETIIAPEFSDPIHLFVIPSLAASYPQFPLMLMIKYLNQSIDDNFGFASSISTPYSNRFFTSFSLYTILNLNDSCNDKLESYFSDYICLLAVLSDNINRLNQHRPSVLGADTSCSDDDDDNDEKMDITFISPTENQIIFESIKLLNNELKIKQIIDCVECSLDDQHVLLSVCKICTNLITNHRSLFDNKFLYAMVLKPKFIRSLWILLTSQSNEQGFLSPLNRLSKGIHISGQDSERLISVLVTFCTLFGRLISNLHDGEFCQEDVLPGATSKIMPFTLREIVQLSGILKDICLGLVELAFPETRQNLYDHYRSIMITDPNRVELNKKIQDKIWPHLLKVCVSLLRKLYTRDLRCGFCPENHWTVETLSLSLDKISDFHLTRGRRNRRPFQPIKDFTREDFESDGPPLSIKQIRSITILKEFPFVVSFNNRVGILQGLLAADKIRAQGDAHNFLQGTFIQLLIRRSHIYEDAFDKLRLENEPDLRPKFRIQMMNSLGLEEAGIDGGGIFREFLSELFKTAFDPNRGFFMITTDNKLYPNPSVGKIMDNYQQHYYFIGRILGKAIYENLLVELPLADFFLSKLVGKHSDVDVHQLASLDPVLHRNLLSLKAYNGDVTELGLDFTVVSTEMGETVIHELIPNGSNICVNNSNRIEYIQLLADYKLNKQIRQQCVAFRKGLANVINIEWLYMFSNKEFQVLISGAEIPVDIDDLMKHTNYGGDFDINHPTIKLFWEVLQDFDDIQRRQLLKFVTSCSRPPLLGFRDLDPPFCIQNAGDTERLPSASTCMNLLKLPAFNSSEQLRSKLLFAIQSGAGFELS